MRSLLREPLLHFLALGSLLFLFFEWRGGGGAAGRIVVTSGQVQHLAAGFVRARMRPPTHEELKELIDEHVKEEMATREAMAAGLDRDDAILRRRLRQKLEFLVEDAVEQAPPSDADLRRWLDTHRDAIPSEPQVALRQVFVSAERRGAGASAEAARLLTLLRAPGAPADLSRLGDRTLLPRELPLVALSEVSRTFGERFATAVGGLEPGRWAGPIESTYGLHLVLVTAREAPAPPDLSAVRALVEREVASERRREALDKLYAGLLAKYSVTIEWPSASAVDAAAAGATAAGAAVQR